MADDTTNPIPNGTVDDITNTGDAAQKAANDLAAMSNTIISSRDSFTGMGSAISGVNDTFSRLGSAMRGFGVSLNEVKSLTAQQREQLTLVTAAVVGARESFTNLAGVDSSGLSTFTGQLRELMSTIKNEGPLASVAADALVDLNKKMGASDSAIAGATAKGIAGLSALAQSMITAADNGLRLQNAVIQLSARTGSLGDIFQMAGPKLENMNALLAKHQQIISDARTATGAPTAQIEKYYSALGSVPSAMSSLVKSSLDGDNRVSMLAATMKVATGTGRDFTDVVDDLRVAFRDYGIVGEDALKFSTQMSEISQNLGVELDTVRKALQGTSDTFKMFAGNQKDAAKMASEFADIMNRYSGILQKTGLNGTQAVDVVKNMTGQLSNLTIAQKAFLSAQTGGPGGLMGSFQIDKMMREGRVGEVFEKVRQQMTKQFGNIATREEAETSQSGAAQRTRQMMLLRQGPLGQFARSDVEAQRILDGFSGIQKGTVTSKGLSESVVQESMDKGTAIQEKSYTVLTEINAGIAGLRDSMNIGALGMAQKSFAAGNGTGERGVTSPVATHLQGTMRGATNMREDRIRDSLANDTANKRLIDTAGRSAAAAVSGLEKTFSGDFMSNALKQPLEVLKNAFSGSGKGGSVGDDNIQKAKDELSKDIARRKESMSKLSIDKRATAMDQISKEEDALSKVNAYQSAISTNRPPGAQVGVAANRAAAVRNNAPGTHTGSTADTGQAGSNKSDVTVHVTGYCIKCKQEIEGGSQAKAVNKASQNI